MALITKEVPSEALHWWDEPIKSRRCSLLQAHPRMLRKTGIRLSIAGEMRVGDVLLNERTRSLVIIEQVGKPLRGGDVMLNECTGLEMSIERVGMCVHVRRYPKRLLWPGRAGDLLLIIGNAFPNS